MFRMASYKNLQKISTRVVIHADLAIIYTNFSNLYFYEYFITCSEQMLYNIPLGFSYTFPMYLGFTSCKY